MSPYVVLPAEATSTRLPPAPGQQLRRHVRPLQVASDAADIHSDDDEAGITDDDYYDDYDAPIYSKPGDRDRP